jgi:ADP-heptose:LPS heptosyltransferase
MTPAEQYDLASAATNAARDALKATLAGRLWYVQRHHHPRVARLLRRLVRAKADRYDAAMFESFHAMAAELGLPVLTTRKPS